MILGEWKPKQIIIHRIDQNEVVLDLSDSIKLSNELFLNAWAKSKEYELDTQFLMSFIEQKVQDYQNTSLVFEASNKFIMKNYNLLLLNKIPGWHLGDTIHGEWILNHDTLFLSAGPDKVKLNWKFMILNLSPENLRIQEMEGESRKELLFTKD